MALSNSWLEYEKKHSGEIIRQLMFAGNLGLEPVLAPWDAISLKLQSGEYRVTLKTDRAQPAWIADGDIRDNPSLRLNVNVQILNNLIVKQIRTQAALA